MGVRCLALTVLSLVSLAAAEDVLIPLARIPGEPVAQGVRVRLGTDPVRLAVPAERQDLRQRLAVEVVVHNPGSAAVAVHGVLNGQRWSDGAAVVPPGGTATLALLLKRTEVDPAWARRFPGMKGLPGGHLALWSTADPARIAQVDLTALDAPAGAVVEVRSVRATGTYAPPPAAATTPLLDTWGQLRTGTWPGKVASDGDLTRQQRQEAADLAAHPRPTDWNAWGGWAAGPRLAATGRFRTARHEGRWWLVDPDGRLFWSHGVTCVGMRPHIAAGPGVPWVADPLPAFLLGGDYHALSANLWRKYGSGWEAADADQTFRRLGSWGLNTLGNWSSPTLAAARRVPYTVAIHYGGPRDAHGFPQVRDPGFRAALRERLERERTTTATDPWCIGYFVDNELHWPSQDRAALAEAYYRTCREEVRRVAPDALYLGSRLHGHHDAYGADEDVARAAAAFADVVSINRYRFSPSDLRLPSGCDVPLLIGEFHWGALDRGLLHPGLRSVADQAQRGALYTHYVTQALAHPAIVGTHWFQWYDQPVTGRGDGENYQCGFVDVTDRPSAETVAAARALGGDLYRRRAGR